MYIQQVGISNINCKCTCKLCPLQPNCSLNKWRQQTDSKYLFFIREALLTATYKKKFNSHGGCMCFVLVCVCVCVRVSSSILNEFPLSGVYS